jgi:hypothetical protein
MHQPMDHGYLVDPRRPCEAKVKGSYRWCKKPAIVDRHFCAYHSGLAGPRFDPFRKIGLECTEQSSCPQTLALGRLRL